MKKKLVITAAVFIILFAVAVLVRKTLYSRGDLELTFDADYYFYELSLFDGMWEYNKVPAGFEYYLYIPPKFRNDRQNESAKIPLIVTFHGASSKAMNLTRYGRMFTDKKIQNIKECAVLVPLARHDYYSDTHDMSLLIQNVLIRNKCLDKTKVIGFGHSQGAEFVVKVACREKNLFRAAISGSGYYQPTFSEYINALPVQFYWKISKYDKGIYEQGYKTGRRLAKFCRNSVNIERDSQVHAWVELDDKIPGSGRTFLQWFASVVQ